MLTEQIGVALVDALIPPSRPEQATARLHAHVPRTPVP